MSQAFVDMVLAKVSQDRKREAVGKQLTISEILYRLTKLPEDALVLLDNGNYPGVFSCYRGYYEDLAIGSESPAPRTREQFERDLNAVMGDSFEGYKGGHYVMGPGTLVWVAADNGDCSNMMVCDLQLEGDDIIIHTKKDNSTF